MQQSVTSKRVASPEQLLCVYIRTCGRALLRDSNWEVETPVHLAMTTYPNQVQQEAVRASDGIRALGAQPQQGIKPAQEAEKGLSHSDTVPHKHHRSVPHHSVPAYRACSSRTRSASAKLRIKSTCCRKAVRQACRWQHQQGVHALPP